MKIIIALPLVVAFIGLDKSQATWSALRGGRQLTNNDPDHSEWYFLVSSIDEDNKWCLSSGDYGDLVKFERCKFGQAPGEQLWQYDFDDLTFRNYNSYQCMGVGTDPPRARMVDCDDESAHLTTKQFHFDIDGSENILLLAMPGDPHPDTELCLANQGTTAETTDIIIALPCKDQPRFKFMSRKAGYARYAGTYGLVNDDAYPESGALVVKDENAMKYQQLILGPLDQNHEWRYDKDGLFHTTLDQSLCMQVNYGDDTDDIGDMSGKRIRLNNCNKNNKRQLFDYNWIDIKFRHDRDLCVGFAGRTSDVGEDNLILKDCDKNGNNWSQD